ncbi:hypothetical protein [Dendronalium sp. ChiSLP03b]|uniref:hypothetical protein n=1 Tax=Dendronalium sp. ChiSLP03b TaxID=3075381 RepID=UPI002ADCB678|nr:hypothetical protein [Dendronalium sp. ChiSLP03b]
MNQRCGEKLPGGFPSAGDCVSAALASLRTSPEGGSPVVGGTPSRRVESGVKPPRPEWLRFPSSPNFR